MASHVITEDLFSFLQSVKRTIEGEKVWLIFWDKLYCIRDSDTFDNKEVVIINYLSCKGNMILFDWKGTKLRSYTRCKGRCCGGILSFITTKYVYVFESTFSFLILTILERWFSDLSKSKWCKCWGFEEFS